MNDMMVMANAILPFILMAGIFYFMLWRPQKQEQKRRKEMLDSLKRGDKIITIGGMYGTRAFGTLCGGGKPGGL